MNESHIIFRDYETGSRSARHTQPLQLAAVAIDGRKLELIPNGIFKTLIKPIFDPDEAKSYGLEPIDDEALQINKLTREELKDAPTIDVVWPQYINFIDQFNLKKNKWTAPIPAGFNSNRFDDIIDERIIGGQKRFDDDYLLCEKEPYKLGPWQDDKQENKLFHPRDNIDLMRIIWYWTENNGDVTNINFDTLRTMFGITKVGAHDALGDVLAGALLLIRFLKVARRGRLKFDPATAFQEENKIIERTIAEQK